MAFERRPPYPGLVTGYPSTNRIEALIPYLFTTPDTNGHGSLAAAVGAIIAELQPGMLYEFDGHDCTADQLAKELLLIVAAQEISGTPASPIRFSRSHSASIDAEFSIVKRDDATVYIVTEDAVIEAGAPDDRPDAPGADEHTDRTARNLVAV